MYQATEAAAAAAGPWAILADRVAVQPSPEVGQGVRAAPATTTPGCLFCRYRGAGARADARSTREASDAS